MHPIIPIPSSATESKQPLSTVLSDERAIASLIEQLLRRSGISQAELCRRLGIKPPSLAQYRNSRRASPSLKWFIRLAEACGARLFIEYPKKQLFAEDMRDL